jgi:hypothetical protein
VEDIDEAALLQSVYEQSNPPAVPIPPKEPEKQVQPAPEPEQPKEDNKRKRSKSQDYESLFIRESTVTARLGKTVYIRKEYHDRILKIIQVIGGNEVSLFSYIDNVLAHHFDNFQDDISQVYKQRINDNLF